MESEHLYTLKGRLPVKCRDVVAWGQWYEASSRSHGRHVADEVRGGIRVSTVFLGVDHQFGDGPPLLFETMIFADDGCDLFGRYSTWTAAEKGHEAAKAKAWGSKKKAQE
jgi:hypothetical protein